MGPYCKFCDNRCFVPVRLTDEQLAMALERQNFVVSILATCAKGREFDKEMLGFNIDDVKR
jgi:hypothetical protein